MLSLKLKVKPSFIVFGLIGLLILIAGDIWFVGRACEYEASYTKVKPEQCQHSYPLASRPVVGFVVNFPSDFWHWLHDSHEEILGLFTIGICIVTGLLAWYTKGLFNATVKLGRDAKTTADRQFTITMQSLQLTRDTSNRELRPYLGIEKIHFTFINPSYADTNLGFLSEPEKLVLVFKNFGKTPGYEVEIQTLVTFTPMPFNGTWTESPKFSVADHRYQMVNPDQVEELTVDTNGVTVNYSTKEFYLYGVIRYRSPIGGMQTHIRLEFCRKYIGTNKFAPHGPHNQEGTVGEPMPDFLI